MDVFDTRTDVYTCTVSEADRDEVTVSRRIKVFVNHHRTVIKPITTIEEAHHQWTLAKPSIVIRHGHEFKTDGEALGDDPICMFYSVAMYGDPPATLKTGTSWHFDRAKFSWWCKKCTGTTTVTNFDKSTSTVSLRIMMTAPNDAGYNPEITDMLVKDGGVIESETDRGAFAVASAIPKDIGTPSDVVVWSHQHP